MADQKNQIIITRQDDLTMTFFLADGKPVTIDAQCDNTSIIGNIYLARVQNIVSNIRAAFVEIAPGETCFLPFDNLPPGLIPTIGKEILIQISKESSGSKEPEATGLLSLTGEHILVTYPDSRIGISHKIKKEAANTLKRLVSNADLRNNGVVIRTSAIQCLDQPDLLDQLFVEVETLSSALQEIREKAKYSLPFTKLYQASPGYLNQINALDDTKIKSIMTDIPELFLEIKNFCANKPSLSGKVLFYEDSMLSMKKLFKLDSILEEAIGRKVWLKSGGFLVIDRTEAMTVIDVNTGKSGKSKVAGNASIYFKLNQEAAKEIAAQIRLRNLSGIILVDFINMADASLERQLLKELEHYTKTDPIQTNIIDITALGLVEITRKKTKNSLYDQLKQSSVRKPQKTD